MGPRLYARHLDGVVADVAGRDAGLPVSDQHAEAEIDVRGKPAEAEVTKPPFYKRPY
jgi:hypothetical protein